MTHPSFRRPLQLAAAATLMLALAVPPGGCGGRACTGARRSSVWLEAG